LGYLYFFLNAWKFFGDTKWRKIWWSSRSFWVG